MNPREDRGYTDLTKSLEIATILDLEESQVVNILAAMQGVVLEDSLIPGWKKRNPIDEYSNERVKKYREKKKLEKENCIKNSLKRAGKSVTECNGLLHVVTECNEDKIRYINLNKPELEKQKPVDNFSFSTKSVLFKDGEPILPDKAVKSEIDEIWEFWKKTMNHPKSKLDSKRKRRIVIAISRYSIEDLKKAIVGCRKSEFHMGKNDTGTVYDDIELIFRDSAKIESFIDRGATNALGNKNNQNLTCSRSLYDKEKERERLQNEKIKKENEEIAFLQSKYPEEFDMQKLKKTFSLCLSDARKKHREILYLQNLKSVKN